MQAEQAVAPFTFQQRLFSFCSSSTTMHAPLVPVMNCIGGDVMNCHDLGAPRIAFLPVQGLARDIPSDTDSDGRDENFVICSPPRSVVLKNYFGEEFGLEFAKR